MRKEIEQLEESKVIDFRCHFTVDKTDNPDWKGSTGYVTEEMIKEHLHEPAETLVLLCGPGVFTKKWLPKILEKAGYERSNIFIF